MGQGDDHVGALFQLRDHALRGLDGVFKLPVPQIGGFELRRLFGDEAVDPHLHVAEVLQKIRREGGLALGGDDVGVHQRAVQEPALPIQNLPFFVELVVPQRHRVEAQHVHGHDVGHGVVLVGFGNSGVEISGVEQEHVPSLALHLLADLLDQGGQRREAPHSRIIVHVKGPRVAVGVVDVEHRQPGGFRHAPQGKERHQQQRQNFSVLSHDFLLYFSVLLVFLHALVVPHAHSVSGTSPLSRAGPFRPFFRWRGDGPRRGLIPPGGGG